MLILLFRERSPPVSEYQSLIKSGRKLEVTYESFAIFSFVSVLAVPLAMAEFLNWSNLIDFIYIGISVTVVVAGLIFITLLMLKSILEKLSQKNHFFAMLIIISIIGALRGILIFYAFEIGGFEQPTELHLRVITSTASTLFWLVAISLAVQDTRNYQRKYRILLKSSILRIAQEVSGSESKLDRLPLSEELQQIESTLNRTFDEAIRSTVDRDSLLRAALKVRQTVDELVRPLSHRLWVNHFNQAPRIKLWVTLVESIRFLNVQPLSVAAFLTLISAFNLTSDFGAVRGLIGSATVFTVTFFSLRFLDKYLLRLSQGKLLLNFFYLLLPGTLLGTVLFLTNDLLYKNDTGLIAYAYVGLVLIVAVLSSTRELTRNDKSNLLIDLHNKLSTERSNLGSTPGYSNAEVASFLHNSLQSELLALSYQLEDLANNPDPLKSKEILEQLGSRINRSISRDFDDFVEDPLSRLNKLTASWRGIATISLTHDDLAQLSPNKALLVVQIIEEAISNAVRYAKASNVSISIKLLADDAVELVIINDGQSHAEGNRGLGTEWLDRYAAGKWSRQIKDGQVALELIL